MRSPPDVELSILLVWVGSFLFLLRLLAGLDGLALLGLSAIVLGMLRRLGDIRASHGYEVAYQHKEDEKGDKKADATVSGGA